MENEFFSPASELQKQYLALKENLIKGNLIIEKIRDLSLVRLIGEIYLVIACDSNASIGEKPFDSYHNSYEEMAVSALKVPLMEVLATGATPIVIVDNLCVEMDPSGKKIIEVMKAELERCKLWDQIQLTGSTEDNMTTVQTGIGVTVIGLVAKDHLKTGKTKAHDIVICIGVPRSGIYEGYSERAPNVAKIETVMKLTSLEYVDEILPVGSKGVLYEACELARVVGYKFRPYENQGIDLLTSAGSSTAVLVSLEKNTVSKLSKDIDIPFFEIGVIE